MEGYMFLKTTMTDGTQTCINANQIKSIIETNGGAIIQMIDGVEYEVTDRFDHICFMLRA